jgi:hypothetical protein
MKKISIVLVAGISLAGCQKKTSTPELTVQQKNEKAVQGKWQFVSFTDSARKTITNAEECWADNTLELRDNRTAVISQGTCIDSPGKSKDIEFKWAFIADDIVDMGTDTVKLTVNNDTALQFQRINKTYLEYKWKRKAR